MDNTIPKAISYLGTEFNDFLYAPVGVEKNGMQLSVLSALARQNVDPWQEAAQLTRLPEKTAIQRLMSLIPPLSDGSSVIPDRNTIAIRLVALLPHSAGSRTLSHKTLAATDMIKVFSGLILYVAFVLFALGAQSIVANHQPQVDGTHDPDLQRSLPINTVINPNPATIKQAEANAEAHKSSGVINAR